jgi:hypothetical protein
MELWRISFNEVMLLNSQVSLSFVNKLILSMSGCLVLLRCQTYWHMDLVLTFVGFFGAAVSLEFQLQLVLLLLIQF